MNVVLGMYRMMKSGWNSPPIPTSSYSASTISVITILLACQHARILFQHIQQSLRPQNLVDSAISITLPKTTKKFYSYKLKDALLRTYFYSRPVHLCEIQDEHYAAWYFKVVANSCLRFIICDRSVHRQEQYGWVGAAFTDNTSSSVCQWCNGNALDAINGGSTSTMVHSGGDAKALYYLDKAWPLLLQHNQPRRCVYAYWAVMTNWIKSSSQPGSGVKLHQDIRVTQNNDSCASAFSSTKGFYHSIVAKGFY